MKKILMGTLAAAILAAGNAFAAPDPLQDAGITIAATYDGAASGMLGMDDNFGGSNISHIDPSGNVEFITADWTFGVGFSTSGLVTIYNNSGSTLIAPPNTSMSFDFSVPGGTTLSKMSGITLLDFSVLDQGTPVLTLVGADKVNIDLSNVSWSASFTPITAQINFASPVPEPSAPLMLLVGIAGIGLASRKRG